MSPLLYPLLEVPAQGPLLFLLELAVLVKKPLFGIILFPHKFVKIMFVLSVTVELSLSLHMGGSLSKPRKNAYKVSFLYKECLCLLILSPLGESHALSKILIVINLLLQLDFEVIPHFSLSLHEGLFMRDQFLYPLLVTLSLPLFLIFVKALQHVDYLVDVIPFIIASGNHVVFEDGGLLLIADVDLESTCSLVGVGQKVPLMSRGDHGRGGLLDGSKRGRLLLLRILPAERIPP